MAKKDYDKRSDVEKSNHSGRSSAGCILERNGPLLSCVRRQQQSSLPT